MANREIFPELATREYSCRTYAEWVALGKPALSDAEEPAAPAAAAAAAEPAAAAAAEPPASPAYQADDPEYVPESPVLLEPAGASSAAAAAYPDPFHPGADPTALDNGLPVFVQSVFYHRGAVPCLKAVGCDVCRRVLAEQDEAVASKMQEELDAEDGVQPAPRKRGRRVRFASDSRVIIPEVPAAAAPAELAPPTYEQSLVDIPVLPPPLEFPNEEQRRLALRRRARYGVGRKRKVDTVDLTKDDDDVEDDE
jgi:hypothetical protein